MPRTQKPIIPTIHPTAIPTTAPSLIQLIFDVQLRGLTQNPLSFRDIFEFIIQYLYFCCQMNIIIQISYNMDIVQRVQTFVFSNEFWIWHGFVLSFLWVIVSALAILAKRFSTKLHLLLFLIVDFTTLFFAGSALYRVLPGFSSFAEWSLLKKGHVLGGSLFLVLMIVQHVGGVTSYFGNKANPAHRQFGRYLANIGRIIAAVGWTLAENQTNSIIVIAATVVIVILSMLLKPQKPGRVLEANSSSSERSKSPKARRQ